MAALIIQGASWLAGMAALVVIINAKTPRLTRVAQALMGVFMACAILTQGISAQESARAEVAEKVSHLAELGEMQLPSELRREGRELMTSSIESALGLGLGRLNLLLLILGGSLLGMSLGQLLALYRERGPSLVAQEETGQ